MTQNRQISVVVGTLNRLDLLKQCIESIGRETSIPYKIYVIDAGSTDGTVEYLAALNSDCVVTVLQGSAVGQAAAYNAVFKSLETPYAAWISDDNVIVNNILDTAVSILEDEPRIGLVGLKVRDLIGPFAKAPYVGGISSAGILNVNQGVLPTSLLKQIGGFSEEFRDYGIDPDLTAKVLICGRDVVLTKAIGIHHYRQWDVDQDSPGFRKRQEKQERALAIYERKYRDIVGLTAGGNIKNMVWLAARRVLGRRISYDSRQTVLGLLPRDWSNLLGGRFIRLLDPIYHRGASYHFRQRLPRQFINKGVSVGEIGQAKESLR